MFLRDVDINLCIRKTRKVYSSNIYTSLLQVSMVEKLLWESFVQTQMIILLEIVNTLIKVTGKAKMSVTAVRDRP